MCVNMSVDMCVDVSVGMSVDMCVDMCVGMCADMCADMCVGMCADMYVDADMCIAERCSEHGMDQQGPHDQLHIHTKQPQQQQRRPQLTAHPAGGQHRAVHESGTQDRGDLIGIPEDLHRQRLADGPRLGQDHS